jgi:uncharacterized membrane protein YqjE
MSTSVENFLSVAVPVLLFGAIGIAVVLWSQKQVKRRRLLKLGFTNHDLKVERSILQETG